MSGYTLPSERFDTQITCPECGFNYQHLEGTHIVPSGDDYRAGWGGRGDLVVLVFDGECGHKWELCFGFHKGDTYQITRPNQDDSESQWATDA